MAVKGAVRWSVTAYWNIKCHKQTSLNMKYFHIDHNAFSEFYLKNQELILNDPFSSAKCYSIPPIYSTFICLFTFTTTNPRWDYYHKQHNLNTR